MAEDRTTVLLVDDHEMFVESVARLLEREADLAVVGVATTIAAGVEAAQQARPRVAVVDFVLPDGRGNEAATRIMAVSPDTQVLILTGSRDETALVAAVEAGCAGFVTKDKALAELVGAIRIAAAGDAYIDPRLLASLLPRMSRTHRGVGYDLTRRERELLHLLAEGHSNQQISAELVISLHTVRNHVQSILTKLRAHSKLEAVAVAKREGLLDDS